MQKRRKYGALVLRDIAVEIQYVPETWCDDAEGKRLRYETYAKQFMERFKKAHKGISESCEISLIEWDVIHTKERSIVKSKVYH